MKDLKVLGVCGGQGALLFPFRDKLIGNIEPRGVFHTGREEQWKAYIETTSSIEWSEKYSFIKLKISAKSY